MLLGFCAPSPAGGIPSLGVIEITARSDDLIGAAGTASEGTVTAGQLANRPLLRPAEVLEVVPGLIISQHSGDGKANQYYLRGFNLDHGTDFATTLMGMPVNLPTNAHGHGYSDLQFLIPELVDTMQYRKGPYAADVGDFATAGSASINYVGKLDAPLLQTSLGQHRYRRALVAGSAELGGGNLLYAAEWTANRGPWVVPENIEKSNLVLRYGEGVKRNGWSVALLAYRAQWTSTDQVPQHAIASGLISRFGSLDPSDGGSSHRYSLSAEWERNDAGGGARANAYLIDYSLDLWSNFTFCTSGCNPGPGDQFQQTDRRRIYGFNAARTRHAEVAGRAIDFTLGMQFRFDDIGKVGLYTTTARRIWGTVREDAVHQGSFSLYGESQVQWLEKFRSIFGMRGDFYDFAVHSNLEGNSGHAGDRIVSPKIALIFGPWGKTEYYLNAGYGFHSNDARGTTTTVNPDFRDPGYLTPMRPVTPLVRAKGYEAGIRSARIPNVQSTLALWRLELASELLFTGDAGTTEASFPSRRTGIEWANYWTPKTGLIVDADLALSRARYTEVAPAAVSGNYIPGAIEKAASVGIAWDGGGHWTGGIRWRYFGPRPLVEDNTVRSKPSSLVNAELGYRITPKVKLTADILNLFNAKVADIDYYYASRLNGAAAPVEDIHTHPAEPRALRLTLRISL